MTTFIINTARQMDPDRMSPEERLAEASFILATGVKRLLKKQKMEKIPLDKSRNQCPYGRKTRQLGERP